MNEQNTYEPEWAMKGGNIDELLYYADFIQRYPMLCIDGKLIDENGEVDTDWLRNRVAFEIMPYIRKNTSQKVNLIINAIKLCAYGGEMMPDTKRIHIRNGTLYTDGTFTEKKFFCRNRLDVKWEEDCGKPEKFLNFLGELLESEDIPTLQEYLGYCLIPSTKGQKMMFIIGSGGEGKSRLGVILNSIFGKNMLTGSFQRIETDRFFRYNLLNKLLMIDDDMQVNALTTTGCIKNIVTAETPIDIEAKGEQSRQANIYTRFLCFGNTAPQALYDKTEGFARRMLILRTKPKPQDRVDDPFLADRLIEEKDRIFRWMFDGLMRLIGNNFKFTLSSNARQNVVDAMKENCNITDFLEDEDAVAYGDFDVAGYDLYAAYSVWCGDNSTTALKRDTFIHYLRNNAHRLNISYENNVLTNDGKRVRGFRGIKPHFCTGERYIN